jgi:hypothetical protein
MFEGTGSEERRESGTEEMAQEDRPNSGGGIGGQGGEGSGAAAATPEIGEEGEVGQTQVPAPDDDPGVPEEGEDRTD